MGDSFVKASMKEGLRGAVSWRGGLGGANNNNNNNNDTNNNDQNIVPVLGPFESRKQIKCDRFVAG